MKTLITKVKKHYQSRDWVKWAIGRYDYKSEENKIFEISMSVHHPYLLVSFEHDKDHFYKINTQTIIEQLLESEEHESGENKSSKTL